MSVKTSGYRISTRFYGIKERITHQSRSTEQSTVPDIRLIAKAACRWTSSSPFSPARWTIALQPAKEDEAASGVQLGSRAWSVAESTRGEERRARRVGGREATAEKICRA